MSLLDIKKPLDLSQPINKNNYKELGEIFGENLEQAVKENEKIAELENLIKNELNADEINIYFLGWGFEFKKDGKEKFVFADDFTPKIAQAQRTMSYLIARLRRLKVWA